jgi:ethanolamine permease
MPDGGGFDTYCRVAFGERFGYLAGASVLVALIAALGVVANFVAAYGRSVLGISPLLAKATLFGVVLIFQLRGVREAASVTLVVTAIAVAVLLLFSFAMAPFADPRNLIPTGATGVLSNGLRGVYYSIPFALWPFLGLEQAALASEEAAQPARTIPRALLAAYLTLVGVFMSVVVLGPAGGGVEQLRNADDPLYAALTSPHAYGKPTLMTQCVGIGVLIGLVATFFSVLYTSSRQLYSLARAGCLPSWLAVLNRRQVPHSALLVVSVLGLAASLVPPDQVVVLVIFLLTVSYLLVLSSFIRLRLNRPEMPRPYRAPGGLIAATATTMLCAVVLTACLVQETTGMLYGLAVYVLLIALLWTSRLHQAAHRAP